MAAASFVTEVLATAGRLEREDVSLKLSKLEKRMEEVKEELFDALERKYRDFYPFLTTTAQLASNVHILSAEMQSTSNKIEKEIQSQLKLSTSEFQDVSSQLSEANALLDVLKNILNIHESLQAVNKSMSCQEYEEAVAQLDIIGKLLEENIDNKNPPISVLETLCGEYKLMKEKLKQTLGEMWAEHIRWSLPADNQEYDCNHTKLSLLTGDENQKVLKKIINALFHLDLLSNKIHQLSDRLLHFVIQPLLSSDGTNIEKHDEEQTVCLVIVSPTESSQNSQVSPADAFKKLGTLLKILNQNILGLSVQSERCNDKVNLLHMVGEYIGGAMVDLIIKQCLEHSIPTSKKQLETYSEVIQITEAFQTKLHKAGFISENNVLLADYVNNVNVLFAKKKSQEILQKARELMTADIHNMIQVKTENPLGTGEGSKKKGKMAENMALKSETQLSVNTFRMATCMISEWAQSLVIMAYETLHEATTSSPACAIQLFYSVRNVFELYCNVVPTYHKDRLEKLPQLAALYHNNCMFIAHHLLILGHQYRHLLPEPLSQGASTFVDLVPQLRRLGTECFLQQMTLQKTQILQYLRSANGFENISEDENFFTSDKTVTQALHHLDHLAKVWRGVLPENIYFKAIGNLLNAMIVEILGCITALEDISADDGVLLHSLLKIITEKAPLLFTSTREEDCSGADQKCNPNAQLFKCVAKWTKLQELMLVLMSNLQNISDRWADGKGLLAQQFSACEIKQLIRAIFQNTERRANILARIK